MEHIKEIIDEMYIGDTIEKGKQYVNKQRKLG